MVLQKPTYHESRMQMKTLHSSETPTHITMSTNLMELSEKIEFLRVCLDEKLTWESQIQELASTFYFLNVLEDIWMRGTEDHPNFVMASYLMKVQKEQTKFSDCRSLLLGQF